MKIEVKNLNQFTSWTGHIVKSLESQVRTAVSRNAHEGEANAKLLTPVDTGHLRRSITTELSDDGLSAMIYTNVEYGIFVEMGTSRQTAQPFMYPTLVMISKKLESEIKKIVRDIK